MYERSTRLEKLTLGVALGMREQKRAGTGQKQNLNCVASWGPCEESVSRKGDELYQKILMVMENTT